MILRSWTKQMHNLLEIGGSHESRSSPTVRNNRSMSDSDTKHHGGLHGIGMEINSFYHNT